MIRFNWRKIYRVSGGSSRRILLILQSMISNKMPVDRYDPVYKYKYQDFSGHSFLLNPEPILTYRFKYTDKELAEYIGLAGFRNYGDYKAFGKKTLDLVHSPLNKDAILTNRLLHIDEQNNIHFIYEDYNKEKN